MVVTPGVVVGETDVVTSCDVVGETVVITPGVVSC